MARPTAPEIKVELDRERTMILNFSALYQFEVATGKDLLNGFNIDGFDAPTVLAFIWACLHEEDEELTLDAVRKMFYPTLLAQVSPKLNELIGRAFAPAELGEDGRPLAPTAKRRK